MAGSYLTPKIISSQGDWFLDKRLPEFKTNYHDPQGRAHHLEITGRYMRCDEHDNPILQGIIHVPNPEGAFGLACLELRSHWPRVFTAGPEFLDLHSEYRTKSSRQSKLLGQLNIEKTSVNKARIHVLATMLYNLGFLLAASAGYARLNAYSLAQAAYALETIPQLGISKKADEPDILAHLKSALRTEYWGYRDDVLESKVRHWHIDNAWCQPVPTIEAGPSLTL